MGLFKSIKNYSKQKINEYKTNRAEEQATRREENIIYKKAQKAARLRKAQRAGTESGKNHKRSKIKVSLNTNGPDPFGFFQDSKPRHTQNRRSKSSGTRIIIQQGGTRRRKKKKTQSYLDQLL
jgi:hypothetical protein